MKTEFNPSIKFNHVNFKATFKPNGDLKNLVGNTVNKSIGIAPLEITTPLIPMAIKIIKFIGHFIKIKDCKKIKIIDPS